MEFAALQRHEHLVDAAFDLGLGLLDVDGLVLPVPVEHLAVAHGKHHVRAVSAVGLQIPLWNR